MKKALLVAIALGLSLSVSAAPSDGGAAKLYKEKSKPKIIIRL